MALVPKASAKRRKWGQPTVAWLRLIGSNRMSEGDTSGADCCSAAVGVMRGKPMGVAPIWVARAAYCSRRCASGKGTTSVSSHRRNEPGAPTRRGNPRTRQAAEKLGLNRMAISACCGFAFVGPYSREDQTGPWIEMGPSFAIAATAGMAITPSPRWSGTRSK